MLQTNPYVVIASMRNGSVETATIYAENENEATKIAMNEPEFELWDSMSAVEAHDEHMIQLQMKCAEQNAYRAYLMYNR